MNPNRKSERPLKNLLIGLFASLCAVLCYQCNTNSNSGVLSSLVNSFQNTSIQEDIEISINSKQSGWKFIRFTQDDNRKDESCNSIVNMCDTNFTFFYDKDSLTRKIVIKDCATKLDITNSMKSPLAFDHSNDGYIFTFYVPAEDEMADSLYDFKDGYNEWLFKLWDKKDRDWALIKSKPQK